MLARELAGKGPSFMRSQAVREAIEAQIAVSRESTSSENVWIGQKGRDIAAIADF